MDPSGFDRFCRALATSPTRRAALAGLTGALTAVASRLMSATPGAAAQSGVCHPLGKVCFPSRGVGCCRGATCQNGVCRCPKRTRRCGQRCLPRGKCCRHRDCPGNQRCTRGRCQCPPGKKRCGKRCIAKSACCRNGECGAHEACIQGRCACASNAKRCGDACIPNDQCCDNGDCTDYQTCDDHVCVNKPCGQGGPCRVFVTAGSRNGAIGGVTAADTICQTAANGSTRTQGGTYKAWMAGITEDSAPAERFTNLEQIGPYILVDDAGTVVANDWADLTEPKGIDDDYLRAPLNVTEHGKQLTNIEVWTWTNVTPGGTQERNDLEGTCSDWLSAGMGVYGVFGRNQTNAGWTGASTFSCSNSLHLYCFEQK